VFSEGSNKYSPTTAPSTAIPYDLGVILRSNGNTPKRVWEKLSTPDENYSPQDSSGVEIVKLML
jgi:hypothetical protein